MEKINFNQEWICYRKGERDTAIAVSVPHDAMLLDERKENCPSGVNSGWYDVKDYIYEKHFFIPDEYKGKKIFFEFEGVYRKAEILINGKKAGYHEYGFTGFYIDATEFLDYGKDNTICVQVTNSDQPNCRWYTGTGIYRPVWMLVMPQNHIVNDGVKIRTIDWKSGKIRVEVQTEGNEKIKVEILDKAQNVTAYAEGMESDYYSFEFLLENARLWEPDDPYMYTCRVTFGEDIRYERFGIRQIECNVEKGFCINGKRIILKGACIHSDNGILGACSYPFAERRKVQILKECGYNAIRCAHNPGAKAFLDACDEMGMLVLDEYTDGWYIHKTKYDYADHIMDNYKEDMKAMVDKDFNHPSVIMYSTGNEVSETAQKKGIELCGEMTEWLHELDDTRPVTCGINIFFNFLSSMGFGVYSDKKADEAVKDATKKKAVGSEFYNTVAGIFGAGFMKTGATLHACDVKTRDAYARMDIAGYNYGIKRYRHDLKKYPQRLILGSETFCADAVRFMDIAKEEPRVIGDFVWSGMDYLGEVGIGSWEYDDHAPRFDSGCGWISAGSGRIDLTGKPLAEMKYTRVAFGLDKIGLAVIPVHHTKHKHSPSAWKMSNALENWTFEGCEGKSAIVEVYSREPFVSLFLNDSCVGTKRTGKDGRVSFKTTYQPGLLRAAALDYNKNVVAETYLKTAGKETVLKVKPENKEVKLHEDLCYVRLRYTDKAGTVKPLVRGDIRVEVEGGTLLGLGSACPYYPDSYLKNVTDTYYGEAMAVIRPDKEGILSIRAYSSSGNDTANILVKG